MRLIDADVLQQRCNDMIQDMWSSKTASVPWANVYADLMDYIGSMPTITPQNEPLTIEQLRQMDGQPVWDENGKCYLVDTTYRFCSCSDIEIAIVDKNGDVKRYPQRRALYRRPPEEECE